LLESFPSARLPLSELISALSPLKLRLPFDRLVAAPQRRPDRPDGRRGAPENGRAATGVA
jgi:hypothetical protein